MHIGDRLLLAVRRTALMAATLCAFATSTVAAQAGDATTPQPEDDSQQHLHGYFLRVGAGVSALRDHVEQAYTDFTDDAEGTSDGLGMSFDLTLTAPIARSWTLGGGAWTSFVFDVPRTDMSESVPDELRRPVSFTVVGLVGQWYFAPQLGLHADTGLGVAVFQTKREAAHAPDDATWSALGPGVSLGLGSDLWTDDHVGLGAVVRVTAAIAQLGRRGAIYQHVVIAPALLLTACVSG